MPRKKNWRKWLHIKAAAAARRILKAGERAQGLEEKEAGLKPTVQELLVSSGSQTKVNCTDVSKEAPREKVNGKPRFGVEPEHLSKPESLGVDKDLPLPGHRGSPPPSALVSPVGDRALRAQRVEQPRAASGSPDSGSLKAEPSWHRSRSGDMVDRAEKRKSCNADSGVPDASADQSRKRQKGKLQSDAGQVDQLLALSLKEEELSRSLLALDTSLIQARTAMQAAFTTVQQLLLTKQQVIAEISCLRARRVEGSSQGSAVV